MEKEKEAPAKETTAVKQAPSLYKYKLVRKSDNLTKEGNDITYVVWKSNGTFHSLSNSPSVGMSMALDLEYGVKSTYITDQITKILEQSSEGLVFETKDGKYELTQNKAFFSKS